MSSSQFIAALLMLVIPAIAFAYLFLRFGPKRCPQCRTWNMGVWGPPVGIRSMHFVCRKCGTKWTGHNRLPL